MYLALVHLHSVIDSQFAQELLNTSLPHVLKRNMTRFTESRSVLEQISAVAKKIAGSLGDEQGRLFNLSIQGVNLDLWDIITNTNINAISSPTPTPTPTP